MTAPPILRLDAAAATARLDELADLARGGRSLLAVEDAPGRLAGTVQLVFATPPNQRHRADVAKLLVHRRARRLGLGRALMIALEDAAREAGRTLLTLDTAVGDSGEALYRALGWRFAGTIPRFARVADGDFVATAFYWKDLGTRGVADAPPRG